MEDRAMIAKVSGRRWTRLFQPAQGIAIAGLVVVVFFLHARWWQGGQVEDWSYDLAWRVGGWHQLFTLGATAGRPLHNLPDFFGDMLSGGSEWGQWLIAGVLAVSIFLAAWWALRPIVGSAFLGVLAAGVVALHPAWEGGFTLRFLGALGSVLGVWLAVGYVLRWLTGGSRLALAAAVGAGLLGMLAYEAAAIAMVVAALYFALLLPGSVKRRAAGVGAIVAAVALDLVWVEVIVRRAFPQAYEASVGGTYEVVSGVAAVARTIWERAPATMGILVALLLAIGVLAATRSISGRVALLSAAATVAAPFTALTYASSSAWLNDPTRVCFPLSVTLGVVVAGLAYGIRSEGRTARFVISVGMVAVAATASTVSIIVWAHFGSIQKRTLEIVEPAVREATGRETVYVVDHSGYLGDVYTFLPPYLGIATEVSFRDSSPVELCTADGVARHQALAAEYPIATTPDCSEIHIPRSARLVSHGMVQGAPVDAYVGPS
jgi:hypothetical protein